MNLAYPYQFSALGRTAETGDERHVRDLIEQILFTTPGERVMQPTLGAGVRQLVFAPNSVEIAGATQMLVQSSLQQWIGNLIAVRGVQVQADDSTLTLTVQYSLRSSDRVQVQTFTIPGGGGT